MFNSVFASHYLSCAIVADEISTSPDPAVVKDHFLQALKTDDCESFMTLIGNTHTRTILADMRFKSDRNVLHVAIQAGSHAIAIALARLNTGWIRALAAEKDSDAYTPLMYAATDQTDNTDVIDALIPLGDDQKGDLALRQAARCGLVAIAQRLVHAANELDFSPCHVLQETARYSIMDSDFGDEEIRIAHFLVSLDIDPTETLQFALASADEQAVLGLLCLGARASEKLAKAALINNCRDTQSYVMTHRARLRNVQPYVQAGADTLRAMRLLLSRHTGQVDAWAIKKLADAHRQATAKSHLETCRSIVLTLLRSRHFPELLAFCKALDKVDPGALQTLCKHLIRERDVDVIAALMQMGLVAPEKTLQDVALSANIAATRALLNTDIDTTRLLPALFDRVVADDVRALLILRILILAGVDTSSLPDHAHEWTKIESRCRQIAALSPEAKYKALLTAAKNNDVVDIALLIRHDADKVAVLRHLADTRHWTAIRSVLKADLNSFDTVAERIQENDFDLARLLLQADDIDLNSTLWRLNKLGLLNAHLPTHSAATMALSQFIKQGRLDLARACIPALTDGQQLLEQAAQDDDEALGRYLLEIGADGAKLVALLFYKGQKEIAIKLLTWDVDTATVGVHLVMMDDDDVCRGRRALSILGVGSPHLLLRAIELKHARATRKLADPTVGALVGPSVCLRAMLHVINDATMPDDIRMTKLRLLVQLGASTDRAVETLAKAGKFNEIKQLVKVGVPVDALMVELAKRGASNTIATLIISGADVRKIFAILKDSQQDAALHTMTMALVKAETESTQAHAEANRLPYKTMPSGRVELQV